MNEIMSQKLYNKNTFMRKLKIGHEFLAFLLNKYRIKTVTHQPNLDINRTFEFYDEDALQYMLDILQEERQTLKEEFKARNRDHDDYTEDTHLQFTDKELDNFNYLPHPILIVSKTNVDLFEVKYQSEPNVNIEHLILTLQQLQTKIKEIVHE